MKGLLKIGAQKLPHYADSQKYLWNEYIFYDVELFETFLFSRYVCYESLKKKMWRKIGGYGQDTFVRATSQVDAHNSVLTPRRDTTAHRANHNFH